MSLFLPTLCPPPTPSRVITAKALRQHDAPVSRAVRTSAPSSAAAVDDNVGLLEGHVWRDDPRLVRLRRGSRNGHGHDGLAAAISARTGSTGKMRRCQCVRISAPSDE